MNTRKAKFVELCIENEVLRFGRFTLKSGRVSPYFFDAGLFNRGRLLGQAAAHYAELIAELFAARAGFMLYGPAYKGIALAAATALKLADNHALDVGYAFHRKEAKDHGEGGSLVGAPLGGEVVIIDDVITAGASIRQSVAAIRAAGATPHAVVIALDRLERAGAEGLSAAQQVEREHGIAVHALIDLRDLAAHFAQAGQTQSAHADAIKSYRERYGVK